MENPNPSHLSTMVQNNSNARMEAILAHKLGDISFREMTAEFKRLDLELEKIYLDWAAEVRLVLPVLQEDLQVECIYALSENQGN